MLEPWTKKRPVCGWDCNPLTGRVTTLSLRAFPDQLSCSTPAGRAIFVSWNRFGPDRNADLVNGVWWL
jgi:hypothetical protein